MMCEAIVGAAPRLRRYVHALLATLPCTGGALPRADQDADDLAHKTLLDMWRGGFELNFDALLVRRATALARRRFAGRAADILGAGGREQNRPDEPALHFAWAPEARSLPRLPLDLRAILALIVLERLSYAEAGRALDMPEARALARLAVARARLASEMSGASRPHLVALAPNERIEAESDLHRFADDLLDADRQAEIAAFLETSPEAARRVAEWRRQSERLRAAFAPLMALPLPPSLDFAAPEAFSRPRQSPTAPRGVFRRLGAFFSAPTGPAARRSL
ncbi:anti-sigma factor family protein [Rhodoblastus sp.]|uniref:anti-sigma factor family protein n=1 Tax=Rhodoblastus sp. TaxID=1962975 RepID=UPI003F9E1E7F